jgi:DNA replication protein DnaC
LIENKEIEWYMSHRVSKQGNLSDRAETMAEEILIERRVAMRSRLRNTKFSAATNNELDNMLMYLMDGYYVIQDTMGYEFYISSVLVTYEVAEERKERALIPREYSGKLLSDFDWKLYECNMTSEQMVILKFIFKYKEFAEKGMGLYIYSKVKGSGKTLLSCVLLNEVSGKFGVNVKFVTALDYLNMTKKSYNGSEDEVNMIRRASLLVVDDIGTQMAKEWIDTTFYELVNYRYNNNLSTIYTSNIQIDKLKMDDRITERIDRNTILLKLPDKSIRKVNGAREKEAFMKEIGL